MKVLASSSQVNTTVMYESCGYYCVGGQLMTHYLIIKHKLKYLKHNLID